MHLREELECFVNLQLHQLRSLFLRNLYCTIQKSTYSLGRNEEIPMFSRRLSSSELATAVPGQINLQLLRVDLKPFGIPRDLLITTSRPRGYTLPTEYQKCLRSFGPTMCHLKLTYLSEDWLFHDFSFSCWSPPPPSSTLAPSSLESVAPGRLEPLELLASWLWGLLPAAPH